ncbi:MAG: (d)CMP kinase [Clostridiales bacterium]|nr:(d)CMP kinase [Clostridiales bacterium]
MISIAVDGPVGAGKSTLCDALAARLGILHLDTGAMYRAVGLYALDNGISSDDGPALDALMGSGAAKIGVSFEGGKQKTWLNGLDVTSRLREEAVGAAASAVSRFPSVRRELVRAQQEIAKSQSLIIDGRDIGTVVLPDAKVKIFLTATPEARARRRHAQLLAAGKDADYGTILEDLVKRDRQDQSRECDPLRPAGDAVILDTSGLDFDESLQKMLEIVESKHGI